MLTLQPLVRAAFITGYDWRVVGVFPTDPEDRRHWFNYTVGLSTYELWCSCYSIEGRGIDNELNAVILNVIGGAMRLGIVGMGDEVRVPLGIPDEEGEWERDAEAIWWIRAHRVPSKTKGVFLAGASRWTVPLIWSSPLGWPDE